MGIDLHQANLWVTVEGAALVTERPDAWLCGVLMTEAERTAFLWGAFILLAFLTTCAIMDLIDQGRPMPVILPEDGPPPSMVSQLIEEAKEITRRAAAGADTDDAE